jgi:hypothetical protein
MDRGIQVQPLPYKTRQKTFLLLVLTFLVSLPFLYLYATGYRFDFSKPTNLVSTGGIYIAVERTGADIFVDGALVRETRTFRKAFYAQNLDAGTHRVQVQKEGYHTWVKELPVSKHLVTEAQAFNLPLVPQVRVISEWQSATGSAIVSEEITNASTTNAVLATTTKSTKFFTHNREYQALMVNFGTTSTSTEKESTAQHIKDILLNSTSTADGTVATSTISYGGVKLYMQGEDLFASWIGVFEEMPYYYCAPDFAPYSTSTSLIPDIKTDVIDTIEVTKPENELVMHPVQTVSKDIQCDPTIRIDRKWQKVRDFDFYPGSTDLVVVALENSINVEEVDDRSWQNVQPLMVGKKLSMHVENGNIYIFDGTLIYQMILTSE